MSYTIILMLKRIFYHRLWQKFATEPPRRGQQYAFRRHV